MLYEITSVRQIPGEPRRRWFSDNAMDLILWHDETSRMIGFQLSYDKETRERAVTWRETQGYSHDRIDDGARERLGDYPATPILVPDGRPDIDALVEDFRRRAQDLDTELTDFITAKLQRFECTLAAAAPALPPQPARSAALTIGAIVIALVVLATVVMVLALR